MTVSSTNSKHIYNGNGVTVNWPYTFTIINTTDIKVYLTNTDAEVSEITTGFTVDELNSRVVYPAVGSGIPVLPTGWKITLVREMDLTQTLDLTRQGPLDSESLEEAYDKLTLIAQQHDEQISRCIIWAIDSTPSTVDTTAYLEQIQAERTAAETAATAAQLAQTNAETAETSAETAQGLAEDARDAAGIAQTAAELAETNAELAQAAAESARDLALGYRDAASGYATTATTQASNASGYATTATTQAGIATTQAANALSSAQSAEAAQGLAEDARDDAITAQGLSEDARDAAIAAQGLAEGARDTAVTAKDDAVAAQGLAEDARDDALLAQAAAESARDLASGYKDTATTQAGLATSAKDDAVIAKNAAETAQGLSEDAKDDAVIAKNAAEAAAALLAAGTFDNELTIKQITTPANPSAGYNKLYVKSDNKFYTKDSSGNELAVGSGSGGGGVNYVGNGDFESNADGWYIYNDGASAVPVDGTGGDISANYLTIVRTTTAGQILRGNASGKLSKTANDAQGWGLGYPIVIAAADKCKPLQFKLSYLTLDANYSYANEDIRAWVYDVDNSQLIAVTPYQWDGSGAFLGEFQATTSLNYRILLHVATTNANAYDIAIDDVSVSPTHFVYGNLQDRQYDLTVTGTSSWSTGHAKGIPYKTKDGTWRLRFNIYGTTSSVSSVSIHIAGITSIATYEQAIAESNYGGTHLYQYINPNSDQIDIAGTTATTKWFCSGDVELASMPTWAVDFYPVQYGDQYDGRVVGAAFTFADAAGVSTTPVKLNLSLNTAAMKDSHGGFDAANNRYLIKVSGTYKIGGLAYMYGFTSSPAVNIYAYKNGAYVSGGDLVSRWAVANTAVGFNCSLDLVAGEYIEIFANTQAGSCNIGTGLSHFEITREAGPATIAASEKVSAFYTSTAALSIPDNTETTVVFATKVSDTHVKMNTSTGAYTIGKAGLLDLSSQIRIAPSFVWNAGDYIYYRLYINSTVVAESVAFGEATACTQTPTSHVSIFGYPVNVGDVVICKVIQTSGASVSLSTAANYNFISLRID